MSTQDLNTPFNFAFVGMGATGTIGFIAMVQKLEQNFEALVERGRPVNLFLLDKEGRFAAGDPYSDPCPIFLLNQRADKMSVFSGNTMDLCTWMHDERTALGDAECERLCAHYDDMIAAGETPERIAVTHPECYSAHQMRDFAETSYASRSRYGDYMHNRFKQALDKVVELDGRWRERTGGSEPMIRTNLCEGNVEKVDVLPKGGYKLTLAKGAHYKQYGETEPHELGSAFNSGLSEFHATHMYVATGHLLNNMLSNLRGRPGYGDTPLTMKEVESALQNYDEKAPVLIVGTGQAMLDALSALEGLGYDGTIRLMSGSLVLPWPQDYRARPEHDYAFSCCSPEHVADAMASDDPMAAVAKLLQDEMHSDSAIEYGGANVLAAIHELKERYGESFGNPELCDKFFSLVGQHENNSTSPEKFAMMQRLMPRLEFVQGRVVEAFENNDGSMKVVKYTNGGEPLHLETSVIINAASMQRLAVNPKTGKAYNPVIESLMEGGILRCDENGQVHALRGDAVIAGPAAGDKVWGVYVMRNLAETEAGELLDHALNPDAAHPIMSQEYKYA